MRTVCARTAGRPAARFKGVNFTEFSTMTERRNLLISGIAVLGVAKWHPPLVSSIIVPAHAQTSSIFPSGSFGISDSLCFNFEDNGSVGTLNIKYIPSLGSPFIQGDFEVSLSNLPLQLGGGLTKDCNGVEIGFDAAGQVLVLIDSYSPSSLMVRVVAGKIGPAFEVFSNSCALEMNQCT